MKLLSDRETPNTKHLLTLIAFIYLSHRVWYSVIARLLSGSYFERLNVDTINNVTTTMRAKSKLKKRSSV